MSCPIASLLIETACNRYPLSLWLFDAGLKKNMSKGRGTLFSYEKWDFDAPILTDLTDRVERIFAEPLMRYTIISEREGNLN